MEINALITVWLVLAILAVLIGIALYSKRQEEKSVPVEVKKASELVYTAGKKPVTVVDVRSEDEKYADGCNKWICRYCETMNTYPPGVVIEKKEPAPPTSVSSEPVSGLRGDLLKKMNSDSDGGTSAVMVCTACGKQQ